MIHPSDVGDGVLGEPGAGRRKQGVAGRVEQPGVRREKDVKDGSQSASIRSSRSPCQTPEPGPKRDSLHRDFGADLTLFHIWNIKTGELEC